MSNSQEKEELGVSETNPINDLVTELIEEIRELFAKYAKKAEDKIGGKFTAGLYPFLRQNTEDGSFRPDARVVIAPIKEVAKTESKNESTGEDTQASGGSQEAARSKEPS